MTTFIYENEATILLNEEVTMENANEIVDFIYGASFLNEIDTIKVSINSPGGSVIGGMSIFSALVSSEKKVITQVDGIAASIAAIIFMAGQERYMMEYGLFMIHNPFGGDEKSLEKIKDSLMVILGEDNFKNLSELMDEETWLNADEMKGLINKVIKVENGEMKEVTNKALELFQVVNQLKKEEMENENLLNEEVENQESSELNETLESNLEEQFEASEEVEISNEIETEEEISEEIEEEVSEEEVEMEAEEVEETVAEETVEIEAESEVSEEVEVEQPELELVENNVEDTVNVVELSNKIKEQEEEISELRQKLDIYEKDAEKKAKLSLLENSNVQPEAYNEWLEMDIEVIEKLAGSVNKVSPSIDAVSNKSVNKVWTVEEKRNLLRQDPEEYARLVRERVIK